MIQSKQLDDSSPNTRCPFLFQTCSIVANMSHSSFLTFSLMPLSSHFSIQIHQPWQLSHTDVRLQLRHQAKAALQKRRWGWAWPRVRRKPKQKFPSGMRSSPCWLLCGKKKWWNLTHRLGSNIAPLLNGSCKQNVPSECLAALATTRRVVRSLTERRRTSAFKFFRLVWLRIQIVDVSK